MSQRFHLPPERRKSSGFPGWTAVLGGFVIGFLLAGLIFGVYLPCWRGECRTESPKGDFDTATSKQLIGSSAATDPESHESDPVRVVVDTVAETTNADNAEIDTAADRERAVESKESAPEPVQMNHSIRVQVLNGCGVKGIASNVAPKLRSMGFDVRETGNAKNFKHEVSKVYSRIGDWTPALIVADSVGIDSSNVGELIDSEIVDIDVTIVVGADNRQLNLGLSE